MVEQPARPVFISLSGILREQHSISRASLERALLFFGSKRFWIWPRNELEKQESLNQPTKYLHTPDWLKKMILSKEKRGEVFFLKPDVLGEPDVQVFGDYAKASEWLCSINDPLTGVAYKPLKLDRAWWENEFNGGTYISAGAWERVVVNFQTGTHDYSSVMELLVQSNPTLLPIFR